MTTSVRWMRLLPYWFLLFTIGFGWFILSPLLGSIITAFHSSLAPVVLLISLYGYTMIALGLLAGWLSARFTVRSALFVAAALSVIGLVGRALSPDYSILFITQTIAAVAYPMAVAPVGSISESISRERAHTITGVSIGVLFLGMAVGSFSGGALLSTIKLSGSFWLTAILAIIALVVIIPGTRGYPVDYKGRSLRGVFKAGVVKNWYVGLVIASVSVMFGGIAAEVLATHSAYVTTSAYYGGLLGGLTFLGSALGAIILPPMFERYRFLKKGIIITSFLAFVSVFSLSYFLSFLPILWILLISFFFFGFFGNAYWSMAMTSTTNYVDDPAKAGFSTSMFSVATNVGVALIPVFVGPLFITIAPYAVALVVSLEFVGFLLSPALKLKPPAEPVSA